MLKSTPWHLGIAGKNHALGPQKSALGPPKSALGLELRSTASGRFWRPLGRFFGGPWARFFPESLGQGVDFVPKYGNLLSMIKRNSFIRQL